MPQLPQLIIRATTQAKQAQEEALMTTRQSAPSSSSSDPDEDYGDNSPIGNDDHRGDLTWCRYSYSDSFDDDPHHRAFLRAAVEEEATVLRRAGVPCSKSHHYAIVTDAHVEQLMASYKQYAGMYCAWRHEPSTQLFPHAVWLQVHADFLERFPETHFDVSTLKTHLRRALQASAVCTSTEAATASKPALLSVAPAQADGCELPTPANLSSDTVGGSTPQIYSVVTLNNDLEAIGDSRRQSQLEQQTSRKRCVRANSMELQKEVKKQKNSGIISHELRGH